MHKNQLQELAQRGCFNLPSYACIREGPDHAPRFKATVNFNGEIFESPTFCSTLKQAEHTAAEVALNVLSRKGPSKALASRILDETGVYKNLIQETAHRAGLKLPAYTTIRSGPSHAPVFSCTVELSGMSFTGEPAKTKKQAQKNAAMTAWSALKKRSKSEATFLHSSHLSEYGGNDEQEQVTVAQYLANLRSPETKNLAQKEWQLGQREWQLGQREWQLGQSYASGRTDGIPYVGGSSGRSLHYLRGQNLACLPTYQTWTQERASQQQSHTLAVATEPSSLPTPQIFPFIQSIWQSHRGQYFPAKEPEPKHVPVIGPHPDISNHPLPSPIGSASEITIQGIDKKLQLEKEWLNGDGSSDSWKINSPSNASKLSLIEISNSLVALNSHSAQRALEMLQEKEEKNGGIGPQTISLGGSSGSLRGLTPAGFAAPVATRKTVEPAHSRRGESPSPFMRAEPPRKNVTSCSRPWLKGIKNIGGMPSANLMAPAVHIRSVVPVCSAPPAKRTPCPIQGGSVASCGGKEGAASFESGKLQI